MDSESGPRALSPSPVRSISRNLLKSLQMSPYLSAPGRYGLKDDTAVLRLKMGQAFLMKDSENEISTLGASLYQLRLFCCFRLGIGDLLQCQSHLKSCT